MTQSAHSRAPRFQAWLDDFFGAYYRHHPVSATFIGHHALDTELPDLSNAGVEQVLRDASRLRADLAELPAEPLTGVERIDRSLAEGFLDVEEWEYGSRRFHAGNPALYTGEAIFGAFSLLLTEFAPLEARLVSLRARLEAVPRLLDEAIATVETAPRSWTERAMRECRGALAFLDEGLAKLPGSEPLDDAAARARAAFAGYRSFLETTLLARGAGEAACGEEAFRRLLKKAHFLEESPESIVRRARAEIDRCREELQRGAREHGARSAAEALARLEDERPSREGYLSRFEELWRASRAHAEARELLSWLELPLEYVPRPEWARTAAPDLYFLFYRAPAPLDALPRVRYLVEPIDGLDDVEIERVLRSTNDSVIKLNHVVHHGGIGHHVQNSHAMRAASRIGRVAGVDCASRIAMPCGATMAEGWACYATDLMDETGFLTPLESYSQHQAHLRIAARAVVDVELHCGERSVAACESFYRETTGMSAAAARAEVTKNGMFPAAALIYFVGAGGIHALRRRLEAGSTSPLRLRRFHDSLLSFGSVPVSLVAGAMTEP